MKKRPSAKVASPYQTTWNLAPLYASDTDPKIERDMKAIERACAAFETKYRTKDFFATPTKLRMALDDHTRVLAIADEARPLWYFHLRKAVATDSALVSARLTQIEQRCTAAHNRIRFFGLAIAGIPTNKHTAFLTHRTLAPYRYMLEQIFKGARHRLTEQEEQLASILSQTSRSMWVEGGEKLMGERLIVWKGKQIPLPQAIALLAEQTDSDRQTLGTAINTTLADAATYAELEVNAVFNHKKAIDERRKYAKPYSATVLGYENEDATVEHLVDVVTKRFDIAHRFFKLHAKLLGKKKLTVHDRSAKIGSINRTFAFPDAVRIVRDSFARLDTAYADILEDFARTGKLDVYPKQGKIGGAFCSHVPGNENVYVMLNHVDSIGSVETLAHEMGHAIHSVRAHQQPLQYQDYSIAVAEVASTFFESLVGEQLEQDLSERERVIFLHNKIPGDIATIFRQIACFNFELELHTRIRAEGKLSKDEMAELLAKHLRSYMGDAVCVTQDDGYFFAYWSHIRNFFYVYSYAFGQLVSRALLEKWKADPSYAGKIEHFLSAGGSATPEDIFEQVGINVRDPKFFRAGLTAIEKDIERLEEMTKKSWK